MKSFLLFALFALVMVGWLACASAYGVPTARRAREEMGGLDLEEMIESIADVESRNNARAIGKAGERGRCQFTETTWRAHTSLPWLLWAPVDCEQTRAVEMAHLRWLCGLLLEAGHVLDPALVAAAWCHGVRNAVACIRTDAAQRAANLYWDRLERRAKVEGGE